MPKDLTPITCTKCNGVGYVDRKCPQCSGRGTIGKDRFGNEISCGRCGSSGSIEDACGGCGGSGTQYI